MPSVDFDELFRTTYPRVVAYARSMASREDADDAVAEAYAIAWRRQRDIPRGAARARRRLRAALNPTTTEERPRWNTT